MTAKVVQCNLGTSLEPLDTRPGRGYEDVARKKTRWGAFCCSHVEAEWDPESSKVDVCFVYP